MIFRLLAVSVLMIAVGGPRAAQVTIRVSDADERLVPAVRIDVWSVRTVNPALGPIAFG